MSEYFKKDRTLFTNLMNCFKYNSIFYIIFYALALYISAITGNFINGAITIYVIILFSYFSHRAAHSIFPYNIFHLIHHKDEHNHKWWAILIEWVTNFLQVSGIILIPLNMILEKQLKMKLLNEYVILYYSIVYTTHHMINYHNMKIDTHIRHHQNENTNYGPDLLDVLMGTKPDNSMFEDLRWSIINSLVSTVIILLVYNKFRNSL